MPPKYKGFEFHEKVLKGAKHVVAPMVDASELAWRQLGRRHGADLCYTPMLHSGVFVRDEKYRRDSLQTCTSDRPLIVQFCANDPEILKRAVELTNEAIEYDAVDLNLGCPQIIAKRGHYGSFLQDEWDLLHRLVSTINDNFELAITCKTRIFGSVQRSIDYAKMLESAGCQLLTVHGRTRDQKGALTGLASWDHIEAVRKAVSIPVFANGNIQYLEDVEKCIQQTGVQGVMTAEGHLYNPTIFSEKFRNKPPAIWDMAIEYLDLVDIYPCPLSYARGHTFKLLHHILQIPANFGIRDIIAKGQNLSQFRDAVLQVKTRYIGYHEGELEWNDPPEELKAFNLKYPPWLCQPYVRPTPEEHIKKMKEINEKEKLAISKRKLEKADSSFKPNDNANGTGLSKKKLKKLERNPHKVFPAVPKCRHNCKLCKTCKNPASLKCHSELCKQCCQSKCYKEELDCPGHNILVKSKRDAARRYKEQELKEKIAT